MEHKNLFEDYKYCELCGKTLDATYEGSVCPNCQEEKLFHDVKDFIRANDVTEYDVAYEFNIPVRKVKKWIKEGRIEYKPGTPVNGIMGVHCKFCGKPITFGTVCPECMKQPTVQASIAKGAEPDAAQQHSAGRLSFLTNADD